MTPTFKPGQTVRCTLTRTPVARRAKATVQRLMWLDPKVKRGLRRAQRRRRQDMVVYNRGNRDWYKRETCARIAVPETGATWTLDYSVNLAADLASVAPYLKVEAS